jgi:hypothetical protein
VTHSVETILVVAMVVFAGIGMMGLAIERVARRGAMKDADETDKQRT